MMVRAISLLPLCAGGLSAFLAALTLSAPRGRKNTHAFFVALNVSAMLMCFAYFGLLNLPGRVDPSLAPVGDPRQLLYVVQMMGMAAAPTYWFLFAAAFAGKKRLTTGWGLVLAHVPLAYSAVVSVTNPLHHLAIQQPGPGAAVSYGPLAAPHHVMTFTLIGYGTWLIVSTAWGRGTRTGRRQALVIGSAAVVLASGGVAWSLRHTLRLPLDVNPTPVLFPVLGLALAYELMRGGLADIVPRAALQAFNAISDAAVTLELDGAVAAYNTAAQRLLPGLEVGVSLRKASVELGRHAEDCLVSAAGYVGFDHEIGSRVYWGRVRPARDERGNAVGCVLLLSDVTEMRATQARMLQLDVQA